VIVWRAGVVETVLGSWPGAVEVSVVTDDGPVRSLAYVDLVGAPVVGDRVLLNTTAVAQRLGTGGYAMVVAIPDRLPADPPLPGHLVKARYTPLQVSVQGADEQGSRWHDVLRDSDDLGGMPVVVADLHSAVPAVVAAVLADRPATRVAYVCTDGAALPLAFSRTVAGLQDAGWLAGTVTTGQSFGGDVEAVTVHTGLLAARHVLAADVAVVTQGPGNLGTGTGFGFSGVAAGEAINAAGILGGRPVASLRISGADERERHRGVSHHSLTAYGRVALAPCDVVVPVYEADLEQLNALVSQQTAALGVRHRLVEVAVTGLRDALLRSPIPLSTMGRDLDADPAAFLGAAVAGRHAVSLLDG
jgi:hypothetical protein